MSTKGTDRDPAVRHRRYGDIQILKRIWSEVRHCRGLIVCIFLFGLLETPFILLEPLPLKVIVDSVLGSDPLPGPLGELFPRSADGYGSGLLLAAVVGQVLVVLLLQLQVAGLGLLKTYAGEKITLRFRSRLLDRVQQLSFQFHDQRGTHDSIYRIQYDAPAVQQVVLFNVFSFISSCITLIAMAWIMFRIDAQLAWIAVSVIPILFVLMRRYSVRMRPRYLRASELESSALGVVQEVLTAFRVVKAFGREEHEKDRFVGRSRKGVRARLRLGTAEGVLGTLVGLTIATGTAAVLFVGTGNVAAGRLSLGELLLIVLYVAQMYAPVRTMSRNVATMQKQLASAERAFELMDEVPNIADRPGAKRLARARGEVEFRDVGFSYVHGETVLDRVSFHVEPGTRVGLVGRTGAGKTTLVSLLTRFYDPSNGVILLDGHDIADIRLVDLRRQFGIVLQEPVLFSTTIAENIAYARPEASDAQIAAAAEAAGAHDFISALTDGYDTVVGERGMRLSGGERQRISLARAFLMDAPLLILDEPTSSVDTTTEAGILEAMRRLMVGRTTFMIAHRLGTLDVCDVVLELVDGRVRLGRQAPYQTAKR